MPTPNATSWFSTTADSRIWNASTARLMTMIEAVYPIQCEAGKGEVTPMSFAKPTSSADCIMVTRATISPSTMNLARHRWPGLTPLVADSSQPLPVCSIST